MRFSNYSALTVVAKRESLTLATNQPDPKSDLTESFVSCQPMARPVSLVRRPTDRASEPSDERCRLLRR
jgi:hypothetical protein